MCLNRLRPIELLHVESVHLIFFNNVLYLIIVFQAEGKLTPLFLLDSIFIVFELFSIM